MDRDQSNYSFVTGVSAPSFASGPMLGNIGAPLRTGDNFEDFSFSYSSMTADFVKDIPLDTHEP